MYSEEQNPVYLDKARRGSFDRPAFQALRSLQERGPVAEKRGVFLKRNRTQLKALRQAAGDLRP